MNRAISTISIVASVPTSCLKVTVPTVSERPGPSASRPGGFPFEWSHSLSACEGYPWRVRLRVCFSPHHPVPLDGRPVAFVNLRILALARIRLSVRASFLLVNNRTHGFFPHTRGRSHCLGCTCSADRDGSGARHRQSHLHLNPQQQTSARAALRVPSVSASRSRS